MLCCWKKKTEVEKLSKPLLTDSKSVTGEPKNLAERRPTGFEPARLEEKHIKSEPIPVEMKPISLPSPAKVELPYASPTPLPAPIYIKSELPSVEPKPAPTTIEVKPDLVEVKLTPSQDPIEIVNTNKKKNLKSNKRI
jgi:hypothetical protein